MKDVSISGLQAAAEHAQVSELPARTVMGHKKPLTVMLGAKIYSVIQTLCAHGVSGAPVVDPAGRIMGVITEHDLLLQAATKDLALPIEFTKDVLMVDPDAPLRELIVVFYKKKVRWLPVVGRDKKVLGIIHRIDVLNCLIQKGQKA